VFVAGDLLWYPVEHDRRVRTAPGALVVFGRPKGHQGSDAQFIEGGVAPQVVFEVLSPKNSGPAMARKRAFYEQYGGGVQRVRRTAWPGAWLAAPWRAAGAHRGDAGVGEPAAGVRFALEESELLLYGPDGRPFLTYAELAAQRQQGHQRAERLAARLRALGVDPDAA